MSSATKGVLHLIPVPLGSTPPASVLTADVLACLHGLTHFVAENAKSARAFLKAAETPHAIQSIAISELNEHTPATALKPLLDPLRQGLDLGLISEAGCPAVADPGANLVALAHQEGFRVVPHIGPSSILLALMASGLGGQHFAFHGYLPAQVEARQRSIQHLEKVSKSQQQTQIFIETPYRNQGMFETLLKVCQPATKLCLATDLSLPSETIATLSIQAWKKAAPPEINRRPTVFLLRAAN